MFCRFVGFSDCIFVAVGCLWCLSFVWWISGLLGFSLGCDLAAFRGGFVVVNLGFYGCCSC